MKIISKAFKAVLGGGVILLASLIPVGPAATQSGPTLQSATFFGGSGDQRGTAISAGGGALYVSGDVQPETGGPGDAALVLKYALPSGPSPVWARPYGFGTNFRGIAATNEGVYAAGTNYTLSTDGVGGKEGKSILAKFAPDGSNGSAPGGALWLALPNFFVYTGVEALTSATTAIEGGSTFIYAARGGQPCSFFAYIVAKFDTAGNLVARATDSSVGITFNSCSVPSVGGSDTPGVTVLNGNVYAVGSTGWLSEENPNPSRPTVYKYDPNLNLSWRRKDLSIAGSFNAATGVGNALYAVGYTFTPPGVANSENFLIQKYDEAGTLLWSQSSGGANTDVLTGVVGIGGRVFAVGYTRSQGAGGADAVILEIDPVTGNTLSTTLFGGAQDDMANGVATDGTDLYVVGESRSFAQGGNAVGQNDVMLFRYTLLVPVVIDIKPGAFPNTIILSVPAPVQVAILTTPSFNAASVNVSTVLFAGAAPNRSTLSDVDADGDLDLLLQFPTPSLNLNCTSTTATLTGQTTTGIPIQGTDSVRIVRDKNGQRCL